MQYHETIKQLFALLAQANLADSNSKQSWQVAEDAETNGFYGAVREAILAIAGKQIISNWAETGEVDLALADRKANK